MMRLIAFSCLAILLVYWTRTSENLQGLRQRTLWFNPRVVLDNGMKLFGKNTGVTESYLGIPYAQAPVGDLRWSAPQEYIPSIADKAGLSAKDFGSKCVQPPGPGGDPTSPPEMWSGEENCLFLNVYVPKKPASSDPLPVALGIHGGQYNIGEGAQFPGEYLASFRNDTIVITINYRLNMFGFLGSKELVETANGGTGNYGLLDQRMAMKWVRENIETFGGDSSRVTIFGESAGANSIGAHLMSANSAPYFDAAVMESGGLNIFSTQPLANAHRTFNAVLDVSSCDNVGCLRALSTDELKEVASKATQAVNAFSSRDASIFGVWVSTVDGVELTDDPLTLLESGNVNPRGVPIIMGTNSDEGVIFGVSHVGTDEELYDYWNNLHGGSLNATDLAELAKIYLVENKGTYPSKFEGDVFPGLLLGKGSLPFWAAERSAGDMEFTCFSRHAAQYLAKTGPTYIYHFEHLNKDVHVALHSMELPYVFGHLAFADYFFPNGIDDDDFQLADKMASMWLNFFLNGDPGDPRWVAVSEGANNILRIIEADNLAVADDTWKEQECDFWVPYYKKLLAENWRRPMQAN